MNQKIIWPMLVVLGLWILAIISATLSPEKPYPSAASPIHPPFICPAPKPPIITLVPKTEEIDYDFYRSTSYLTSLSQIYGKALQPDMVTQGLRTDHPQ